MRRTRPSETIHSREAAAASRIPRALSPHQLARMHAGRPLLPAQIFRIVKAAAQRASLPAGISPHWLRHAHASHALDRGAPISLVQATLDHTSVQTTGRYRHARPNDSSLRYLP